jgi:hypothetical protein
MLIGGLLALVIIVGGLASYFYIAHGPYGGSLNGPQSTATTGPGGAQRKNGPPPQAFAPATGTPIFHTTYPNCDNSGAKWTATSGANPRCGNGGLTLNASGQRAGIFLTSLGNGQSLPSSYVVQVQATIHNGGAFGILFFVQPGSADPATFMAWFNFGAGQGATNQYSHITDQIAIFSNTQPLPPGVGQPGQTVTLDVQVNSDGSAKALVNGNTGYPNNASGLHPTGGTIGLAVDPGANVTFKDLAIYQV